MLFKGLYSFKYAIFVINIHRYRNLINLTLLDSNQPLEQISL